MVDINRLWQSRKAKFVLQAKGVAELRNIVSQFHDNYESDNSSLYDNVIFSGGRAKSKSIFLYQIWPDAPWFSNKRSQNYLCLINPRCLTNQENHPADSIAAIKSVINNWLYCVSAYRVMRTEFAGRIFREIANNEKDKFDIKINNIKYKFLHPIHPKDYIEVIDAALASPVKSDEMTRSEMLSEIIFSLDAHNITCKDKKCMHHCEIYNDKKPDLRERLEITKKLCYWRIGVGKYPETIKHLDDAVNGLIDFKDKCISGSESLAAKKIISLEEDSEIFSEERFENKLIEYFLSVSIRELIEANKDSWKKGNRRPGRYRCPERLARLAIKILGGYAWDQATIDALIDVLAEFCHEALNIPSRLDIKSHLLCAIRNEPSLHTLKPFYRDHFMHAVEVCLLGDKILMSSFDSKQSFYDKISTISVKPKFSAPQSRTAASRSDQSPEAKLIRQQWWVAALLHDVGYSVDAMKGAVSQMKFFSEEKGIKDFISSFDKEMAILSTEMQNKFGYSDLLKAQNLGKDHGAICAAHLKSVFDKLGERFPQEYDASVKAIAYHNTRVPRIKIENDPIAALLVIFDSIQSKSRVGFEFSNAPAIIIANMYGDKGENRFSWKDSVFDFKYTIFVRGRKKILKFTIIYEESVNKNSGVFFLWLDTTYNLQRVDIGALGMDIEICFETPCPKQKKPHDPATQLDRLEDCMTDKGIAFIRGWIDEARRSQDKPQPHDLALRYEIGTSSDDDSGVNPPGSKTKTKTGAKPSQNAAPVAKLKYEKLTISMRNLGKRYEEAPLLGGEIGDFLELLRSWKHYNDDRDESDDSHIRMPK